MKQAKISIVTASYTMDRLRDITELLDSIQAQTYPNIETLIVTERLPELADSIRKYITEKGYTRVQVLYNEGERGASSARNVAIGLAKGDIIAFVDDDALPFPDWAEETAKTYAEDSSIIGVTGPILPLWEEESMNWFPWEFYWIFSCTYWDMAAITEVRNGFGTNLSFRREAFEGEFFSTSLGVRGRGPSGWREPGAEEAELALRIKQKTGKRIVYNPQVRVRHRVYRYRLKARFITRRAYWEGYAKAMLNRWYRHTAGETVLSTEYKLLRRILFKLMPKILIRLFRQPVIALRQLWVMIVVLSCVAFGYFRYRLSSLWGRNQPYET
jgi:glycosyltransferase involved in cell wall biosynthesis